MDKQDLFFVRLAASFKFWMDCSIVQLFLLLLDYSELFSINRGNSGKQEYLRNKKRRQD